MNELIKAYDSCPNYKYPLVQKWIFDNSEIPGCMSLSGHFLVNDLIKEFLNEGATIIHSVIEVFFDKLSPVEFPSDIVLEFRSFQIEIENIRHKNNSGQILFRRNVYDEDNNDEVVQLSEYVSAGSVHIWRGSKTRQEDVELAIKICSRHLQVNQHKHLINFVISTQLGFELSPFSIKKPEIDISMNYGKNFVQVHEKIISKLNEKDGKGLVVLYSEPGTGKTSYIEYVINIIKKSVIYIPPTMAEFISSDNFLPFLMENRNSVLIIEDGENVVKKRSGNSSQAVSNILNISDGILGKCLHIQTIITVNLPKSDIDDALLRKGRLIAEYEFGKLSVEESQALSDKLGFNTKITQPMLVAEIYNQDEIEFRSERKKIGF